MIDENDLYHDCVAEVQFHHCFVCNERIGGYYYQQFASGLQVVCEFCWGLKKEYKRTQGLLQELAK